MTRVDVVQDVVSKIEYCYNTGQKTNKITCTRHMMTMDGTSWKKVLTNTQTC